MNRDDDEHDFDLTFGEWIDVLTDCIEWALITATACALIGICCLFIAWLKR